MSDDEPEYEVESIIEARVEKQAGRKKALTWKYRVRWKGYGENDDTWEPVESFDGSEHILERFWERANVGGRDYKTMSLFKAGEKFMPTGPPRRKPKRKSLKSGTDVSPPASPQPNSSTASVGGPSTEKRRRSAPVTVESDEDRPRKRTRENVPEPPVQASPPKQRIPLPGQNKRRIQKNPTEPQVPLPKPSRPTPRKTRPSSFDEIIPASDEEIEELNDAREPPTQSFLDMDDDIQIISGGTAGGGPSASRSNNVATQDVQMTQGDSSSQDEPHPLFDSPDEDQQSIIPSHRERAANPRVKMVDNPAVNDMDGAIPVKARLLGRSSAPSPSASGTPRKNPNHSGAHASGSKPGPGRSSSGFMKKNKSSLLTFEKGALKTVKGRYNNLLEEKRKETQAPSYTIEDVASENGPALEDEISDDDDISGLMYPIAPVPPTAEELLKLAGLNEQSAVILPDFEDETPTEPEKSTIQQSLALAKDKLFPAGATPASVFNSIGTAWKRSTIFGPLGLASDSQSKPAESLPSGLTRTSPFFLNLDTSSSIPVALTDMSPSGSPTLDFIVGNKGPPGKFYHEKSALALINTLRTGGPSAKIVPDANISEEQRKDFELFHSRLTAGELFVAMAGVEVLAICSSDNALISQRLNIPPSLIGDLGNILVTRVVIENYSAYAEAALDANGWV